VGLVVAYNADLRNQFAYIGSIFSPELINSGLGIAALDVFVRYLFATYSFRKLYAEVPEFNLPALGNRIGRLLKEEGRLRGHSYYNGRWWDQLILAIYPDDYMYRTRLAGLGALGSRPIDRNPTEDPDNPGFPR
jgi:RimJ/RimL family protein N-acetyltransferase